MANNTSSKSKTGIIIASAAGLVILVLLTAVVFGESEVGAEYGEPTIEGQVLPPFPGGVSVDTSAQGLAAPTVSGHDYAGNSVQIANDGRAKAIVFLAHWCPHCQAEVPRVQKWLDAGRNTTGVDLYSVSTAANSGRDNYPPSQWLEREGWTTPVVVDDKAGSIHSAFGSGGFPFWVFVNANGSVEVRTAGQLTVDQLAEFLAAIRP